MSAAADKELIYTLALAQLPGMRLVLARQLMERLTPEQFFMLDKQELMQLFGSESRLFDKGLRQDAVSHAEAETEWLHKNNVTPLCFTSPGYPRRLLECDDSPVAIFVCGKPDFNVEHVIAIVGTRRATPYGTGFVNRLIDDLVSKISGLLIVSGLAYGIDVAAHNAALRNEIPTVGVLAHGLSRLYPSQHRNIARQMLHSGGGLLTDYFHDAPIHQGNFLARNRIVAAMSDATIVAESAKKGGAMFTARLASNYGRDVFALPGRSSDIYSEGCNRLIAGNVASLITSADDLIAAMMWKADKEDGGQQELFETKNLSENEQKVIDLINILGEADTTSVAKALSLTIPQAMILISDMEFDGYIVAYPGGTYRLP